LYDENIESIARLIKTHDKVYALTGAGISTKSGLPDFRSPGTGLWEKVDPTKYSTAQVLYQDPEKFFRFGMERFRMLREAEPNQAHKALSWLESKSFLKGIITQNIDGLHFKAGSKAVWEVHGHLRTSFCVKCNSKKDFEELLGQLEQDIIPPKCNCGGMLRPSVVLFGDSMSEAFFEAEQRLSSGCDLMLVIGSSLSVFPVASLPRLASHLIIINLQPTPFDEKADIVIREKCENILEDLVKEFKKQEKDG